MKIFLGITLYNDSIHGKCSDSILKNSLALMNAGHTVKPLYNSDLYIDRSRNMIVFQFLKSDCDRLVFVDSDLEFNDDAILKIIEHDRPLIAGAYRYKKDLEEYTTTLDFSRENNCKEESTGLVYVKHAPTGLMNIERKVFEDMITHYDMKPDERKIYSFFDTGMRFEGDNNWYGEDNYFCKRYSEMGGIIMVEPRITFTHIGTKEYTGNFHEFLMGRSVSKIETFSISTKPQEKDTLKELTEEIDSIVEVGCWVGDTTKELLKTCKEVYVVDTFKGSEGDRTAVLAENRDIHKEFTENVGNPDNLRVLKGDSIEVAKSFNGNKVDMVFIDAGHEYEEVIADIDAWMPKCTKVISGHDYSDDFPGVKKAVNERFDNVNVKDSVWWVNLKETA